MTPFELQQKLETMNVSYNMTSVRPGYIMYILTFPGERWELELTEDGEVEIEIFKSDGNIYGLDYLADKNGWAKD